LCWCSRFILSNGDSLYSGRGQQQLFGYASLLYLLGQAFHKTGQEDYLNLFDKVLAHTLSFQRDDGSFPLVLRDGEAVDPAVLPELESVNYLGWYQYNRYFDYQAFALLFFDKAYALIPDGKENLLTKNSSCVYCDGELLKVRTSAYEAVVAKPGGYLANDLPLPYIVAHGRSLTPSFGGEQYGATLMRGNDHPIPYLPIFDKTLRARSSSFLTSRSLTMMSPLGIVRYSYRFKEKTIETHIRVYSPFSAKIQLAYFPSIKQENAYTLVDRYFSVKSSEPLNADRKGYTANGEVTIFQADARSLQMILRVMP